MRSKFTLDTLWIIPDLYYWCNTNTCMYQLWNAPHYAQNTCSEIICKCHFQNAGIFRRSCFPPSITMLEIGAWWSWALYIHSSDRSYLVLLALIIFMIKQLYVAHSDAWSAGSLWCVISWLTLMCDQLAHSDAWWAGSLWCVMSWLTLMRD